MPQEISEFEKMFAEIMQKQVVQPTPQQELLFDISNLTEKVFKHIDTTFEATFSNRE